MRWFLGYAAAFCLLVFIICQSVIIPTFFMPFFSWQYDRGRNYPPFNGRSAIETIGIDRDELMDVTVELLDYMRGRRDSLDGIRATVQGVEREFFSDLEKRHMIDVRVLYDRLFAVRNISFFAFIALVIAMVLLRYRPMFALCKCGRDVFAGFIVIVLVLTGIIALDFERAWHYFHFVFFDNDYWLLTHRVDLLIDMVSLSFFLHISIFVGGLVALSSAAVIGGGSAYVYKVKRKPGFIKP